jgi:uncharacterized membrane protein
MSMREWLQWIAEQAVLIISAMALLVIVVGTLRAFVSALRAIFSPLPDAVWRAVWLRYARWLNGGLAFLLAADIIETSLSADWESLGRVAAIAVIRTFLNYFLDRDAAEIREG